jgi:hypothetical protein
MVKSDVFKVYLHSILHLPSNEKSEDLSFTTAMFRVIKIVYCSHNTTAVILITSLFLLPLK